VPGRTGNPFPVIAGTSAGAINAAALACQADNFDRAIAGIVEVWENFRAEQVYRSDSIGVINTGARWLTMMSIGWVIARWRRARPRSLLDNKPLEALLGKLVSTERLHQVMREGHLHGPGGHGVELRLGPARHLLRRARRHRAVDALAAPRGALRDPDPAPARVLGDPVRLSRGRARHQRQPRVLRRRLDAPGGADLAGGAPRAPSASSSSAPAACTSRPGERAPSTDYPNLAQIAGHALSNIFLDALAADVERLKRINATLALLPPRSRAETSLKPIEVLVIAPSERLDDIAAKHLASLPLPIRALLRGMGVSGAAMMRAVRPWRATCSSSRPIPAS
jgi:NTE family protein